MKRNVMVAVVLGVLFLMVDVASAYRHTITNHKDIEVEVKICLAAASDKTFRIGPNSTVCKDIGGYCTQTIKVWAVRSDGTLGDYLGETGDWNCCSQSVTIPPQNAGSLINSKYDCFIR